MVTHLLVFVGSLALLLSAAKVFTHAAESVGLALGMTPFAVGVLIISIGTSLPELVTSVLAVRGGVSEIVAGNVLGANISNLLLVLAAVSIAAPRGVQLGEQYLLIDLHFLIGSAFLLVLTMLDGLVRPGEGVVLLLGYALYTTYLLSTGGPRGPSGPGDLVVTRPARSGIRFRDLVVAALSAGGIYVGARFTIDALEHLAIGLSVPPAIVAVTLLSLGTTLPELVVSAVAARAGKPDVAIGNILGSCVFNALGVAGIGAVAGGVSVPHDVLSLPAPVYVAGSLLFYLLTLDRRVSRWEGALFALFYVMFILEVARFF
jgi:cation:H+ antiporter